VEDFPESSATNRHIFQNLSLRDGSFFRIISSCMKLFQKFSAADPIIFENPQLMIQIFPEICGSVRFDPDCVEGISCGLSPPHLHGRGEPPPPKGHPLQRQEEINRTCSARARRGARATPSKSEEGGGIPMKCYIKAVMQRMVGPDLDHPERTIQMNYDIMARYGRIRGNARRL